MFSHILDPKNTKVSVLLLVINICYSPAGRSVLGETVPEVLSVASDGSQTESTAVSQYGPTQAGE